MALTEEQERELNHLVRRLQRMGGCEAVIDQEGHLVLRTGIKGVAVDIRYESPDIMDTVEPESPVRGQVYYGDDGNFYIYNDD